jgi:hypothetical protein
MLLLDYLVVPIAIQEQLQWVLEHGHYQEQEQYGIVPHLQTYA